MFRFLKTGLGKLKGRLRALFGKPWSDETFEELEQILYEADLGTEATQECIDHLKSHLRLHPAGQLEPILSAIHAYGMTLLSTPPRSLPKPAPSGGPLVILVVGVNGSGKTTTIAKLAHHYQALGKRVLLVAADTFRAAAIEQLTMWAHKLNLEIIKSSPGSDPSAVAFDALTAAKARNVDIVLIDTAGRLQNKTDLMHELEKVSRVCQKVIPNSPHETLLVLDATTGQNALDQATLFNASTALTGIILSKLDGTAKGGIALAIYKRLGVPIRWVGTGESATDLERFDPATYLDALLS